jgi:hypothetical protein
MTTNSGMHQRKQQSLKFSGGHKLPGGRGSRRAEMMTNHDSATAQQELRPPYSTEMMTQLRLSSVLNHLKKTLPARKGKEPQRRATLEIRGENERRRCSGKNVACLRRSTSSINFLPDELRFHMPTAAVGMAPNRPKLCGWRSSAQKYGVAERPPPQRSMNNTQDRGHSCSHYIRLRGSCAVCPAGFIA